MTLLHEPAAKPTRAHLMTAPLPQLLNELGVQMDESTVTDEGFLGAAVIDHGRIVLTMPPGRPETERNLIARSLLGNALRVNLSPLPQPLSTERLAIA